MRIGIVVDSACDLPQDFIQKNDIVVLTITVRIGDAVLADHRDEEATLSFLHAHVAERGHEAETTPFSVNQIRDLFLSRLVIDYDHVYCMTITKTRSPIHENAMQASFAILNDYKPVRQAAGHNSPFALRVIDTQNLFAAQAVSAVEAVRLRDSGANAWALLLGADARTARVRIGERVVDLDRVLLLSRWSGDYATLWRGPAFLATPPRPGSSGEAVDWLRARFGNAAAGTTYDASLQQAVRTLQDARGLPADGIAGPLTLMALADDANAPRLRRTLD